MMAKFVVKGEVRGIPASFAIREVATEEQAVEKAITVYGMDKVFSVNEKVVTFPDSPEVYSGRNDFGRYNIYRKRHRRKIVR